MLRRRLALTLCTSIVAGSLHAQQDTEPAAAPMLPPVSVTGAREAAGPVAPTGRVGLLGERSAQDTPFSIQNYTSQLARNVQATTLGDVLAFDPSVRNYIPRNNVADQFVIRGFYTFNSDVSFAGLFGVLPSQSLPIEFFDQVQLIKGPATMLKGSPMSGTIGGSIDATPKRAGAKPNASVTVDYESHSLLGVSIDAGQRFGDPASSFGIRGIAVYRSGTVADEHKHRRKAAMVALDWAHGPVRLAGELGYQDQLDRDLVTFISIAPTLPVPAPPQRLANFVQPWSYTRTTTTFGTLRGEIEFDDAWTLFANFGARKEPYQALGAGPLITSATGAYTFSPVFSNYGTPGNLKTYEGGARGRFKTGSLAHEAVLSVGRIDSPFGGAYGFMAPRSSNYLTPADVPAPDISGFSRDTALTSRTVLDSVALADVVSWAGDALQLTLGARGQRFRSLAYGADGSESQTYRKGRVSPGVAVLYKPVPGWSVYGSYIEGLGSGPTAPAGAANAGQQFPPYVSKQYEVGVKAQADSLQWTAALFQIAQPSGYLNAASNLYALDGEQRNRGLELNAGGGLRPGLRVLGGVTLLDGKQLRTQNGVNDGKAARGAPKVQVALSADWDVPGSPGLAANGRLLHSTSQFVDFANTQSIPAWTRVDLGVRYATQVWQHGVTLRASVENLADRRYWASSARGFLGYGAPRTWLLSATVDY